MAIVPKCWETKGTEALAADVDLDSEEANPSMDAMPHDEEDEEEEEEEEEGVEEVCGVFSRM